MADGVSRSSQLLGCVNLVPGAGLTHALSGIAEAYMDGVPMLVLACGVRADSEKSFQLHDIDQLAVARPVTKAQLSPAEGKDIYTTIRHACRSARTPPAGPVMVEIPANFYLFRHQADLEAPQEPEVEARSPTPDELEAALQLLAKSRRPLLYLGMGAAGAGGELVRLAERLEAPVSTTFQGKGVVAESHPLWLWCGFGPAAPPFVQKIADSCDLTLAVGCRFSEVGTGSYGLDPPQPLVHVDIDSSVLNRNYPAKMAVQADAATFVSRLLEKLPRRPEDGALRSAIRSGHEGVQDGWAKDTKDGRGVTPHRLLSALQNAFASDTVFTADSGNGTFLAMECLRLERPRSFLAPIDYSCMGYAVPAALGAALACPERPVVALAGDGAFLMTGLELLTASYLRLPVVVIVLRDRKLAQIAQFQDTAFARTTASELPNYDLVALCQGMGVEHIGLSENRDVPDVLRDARKKRDEGRPVVVDVTIDYSAKTYFTRGVVRSNFKRLPWADRLRFLARAVGRRLPGMKQG
jgi:acetolactate synthase-1/2/3 large subunit